MLDSRALENPRPSLNKKRLTIAALLVLMSIAWAEHPTSRHHLFRDPRPSLHGAVSGGRVRHESKGKA